MSRTISVDPLTRIEGHLKVETEVEGKRVTDAKISGLMFRGFEQFLQNRRPTDAARITQRVCGVCHEVHGVASMLALENLYGTSAPRNGKIIRDLILGMHLVTDHLLHFYTLSVPDYVDFAKLLQYNGRDPELQKVKDWVVKTQPQFILNKNQGNYIGSPDLSIRIIANYLQTIKVRSICGSGMGILGAKVPFAHALVPGGVTTDIGVDKLMKYLECLDLLKRFVENSYIPDVMEVAAKYKEYFNIGVAYNNFFANASFKSLGTPLFQDGVIIDGNLEKFEFKNVEEAYDSSFYDNRGYPKADKKEAYSWTKSPRYKGKPVEVGPLARMIINKDKDFISAMSSLGVKSTGSSTMERHVARAMESRRIIRHLYELLDAYKIGEKNLEHIDMKREVSGYGLGLSIAARGALIHEVKAEKGKTLFYNMIVPSTWNFGPKAKGMAGVVEKSLIGTPVEHGDDSIEVGRVIRSYDPCTACSIH